jgi:hypothetical protein
VRTNTKDELLFTKEVIPTTKEKSVSGDSKDKAILENYKGKEREKYDICN